MGRLEIERTIERLAEPIALRHGLEIVAVEVAGGGRRSVVRVLVDKPGGVSVDECAAMSEALSRQLDLHDPISGPYTLEVSSPGLDRPLRTLADYDRFAGRQVNLTAYAPVDGQRHFTGRLEGIREGRVRLRLGDGREVGLPPEAIASARLVVDEEELRRDLRRTPNEESQRA